MKVRPLLVNQCDIRLSGLSIHQIRLNRHDEESEWIESHAHAFDQLLLYLTGGGVQQLGARKSQVGVGALFFVPRQVQHSFVRGSDRRPMSLIIDFKTNSMREPLSCKLNQFQLNQVRHQLSLISNSQAISQSFNLESSGHLFILLDILLKAVRGVTARGQQSQKSAVVRSIDSLLFDPQTSGLRLSEIAAKVGYQQDHLNRLMKRQVGLTLGQYRSQRILEQAQKLLKKPGSRIQDVSNQIGFSDQNYFARWFKQQTGITPRDWQAT